MPFAYGRSSTPKARRSPETCVESCSPASSKIWIHKEIVLTPWHFRLIGPVASCTMSALTARPQAPVATWNSINFVSAQSLGKPRAAQPRVLSTVTHKRSSHICSATNTAGAAQIPLPTTAEEMNAQAADAIKRVLADGHSRVEIELLLPINQRSGPGNFLATEAMDYPCNITTEFRASAKCAKQAMEQATGVDIKVEAFDNGGDQSGSPTRQTEAARRRQLSFQSQKYCPRYGHSQKRTKSWY